MTVLVTGSRLFICVYENVCILIDCYILSVGVLAVVRTSIGLNTNCGAGRSFGDLALVPSVTESCLFGISSVIASRASVVCIPADLGTGRSLSLVSYLVVTESCLFGISSVIAS